MRSLRILAIGIGCAACLFGYAAAVGGAVLEFNGDDGPQSWDYTTDNWIDHRSGNPSVWIDGSDALFQGSGAGAIVSLSGPVNSVNSLSFQTAGYALVDGTVTLTGPGGQVYTAAQTTIGSVIAGSVGLTKSGSGTLTLTGENVFSGDTVISSGVLSLGVANALRNSTVNYNSSGTLDFGILDDVSLGGLKGNRSLTLTNRNSVPVELSVGENGQSTEYSGTINGAMGAALRKVGSGTLTLSGSNSCDTILSAGTLRLTNGGALQYSTVVVDGGTLACGSITTVVLGGLKGSGDLSLDGVRLDVGYNGQATAYDGVLSGSMRLGKTGAGTLTLNGQNTFTGDTTIIGGTLSLGVANALQNSTLDLSGSGTLDFGVLSSASLGGLKGNRPLTLFNRNGTPVVLSVGSNNQSTAFTGTLNGQTGAALRKVGSGTLTLSSVSGCDTILSGGTLRLGNPTALQYSTVTVDGGNLACGSFTSVVLGGLSGSGNLSLDNVRMDVGYSSPSTVYEGVLSGSMSLGKVGSGTLTLNAQNTFTGDTILSNGVLTLGAANSLQNSTLDLSSSGTLAFGGLSSVSVGGLKGNRTFALANSNGAPVVLSVGGNNQSTTYSGTIAGPVGAALRKVGSGTLTLNGSNGCDTILSGGVLLLGNTTALQGSTVIASGGSLASGSLTSVVLGGLSGSGNLSLGNVRMDVGYNNQTTVFGGILSGNMIFKKVGSGMLTLCGPNTFTGDTIISSGILTLGVSNALQNSTLDCSSSGTLAFGVLGNASVGGLKGVETLTLANSSGAPVVLSVGGNNQATEYSGTINGPAGAALKKVGLETLVLSGSIGCDTILSGGTIQLGRQAALQASTLNLDGGALIPGYYTSVALGGLKGTGNLSLNNVRLDVGFNNQTTVYDGILSGNMMLAKTGSGTLTLNGLNTFTGDTVLSNGILTLGAANILQNSTLDLSSSGAVSFGTLGSASIGGLKGNRALTLANVGGAPVVLTVGGNNQATVYSGTINGPAGAALKKVGLETLVLSGAVNCDTILSNGTLQLGYPLTLQNSTLNADGGSLICGSLSSVVLGGLKGTGNLALDNVRLDVGNNGQTTVYDGTLSGSMTLKKVGSGTLTLNRENTFTGDTLTYSGVLALGAANALKNSTIDHSYSGSLSFGGFSGVSIGGLKGNRSLTLATSGGAPVLLSVGGNNQSTVYGGAITGPMGSALKKVGSGTLVLSGSIAGCDTILSSGTLQLGSQTALQYSMVNVNGGSLACGTFSAVALGGLKGNGNLLLNDVRLDVGYNGSWSTYKGILAGNMSLRQSGVSSMLTLKGENTFSGDTLLGEGLLVLDTPRALQNSTVDHSYNGMLVFGSVTTATIGGLKGNRVLTLTNALDQPMTLTVGGNGQSTAYSGALSGTGGITKTGGGTLYLSGNNSYTGTTTVTTGGLTLVGNGVKPSGAWRPVLELGGADIQGGSMLFQYPSDDANPRDTIKSLLAASYHGGAWDVGQFRSSTAATLDLTLGWEDDGTNVTVKLALPGDFNLDATVDEADQAIWLANAFTGSYWSQGDANYDGVVDGYDRDIWFANVGRTLAGAPIMAGARPTAIPEPGTLSLLALGLLGTLWCIRRKH